MGHQQCLSNYHSCIEIYPVVLMSLERSCCKVLLGLPLFRWPANSTRGLRDQIDCTSGLNFFVLLTTGLQPQCSRHDMEPCRDLFSTGNWDWHEILDASLVGKELSSSAERDISFVFFSGSALKDSAKFRTTQGDQHLAARHEFDKKTISRQNLAWSQHHHQHHFIWILSLAALGSTILNNSTVLYDCLL